MKLNWGTGIFLSFVVFALAIAYIIAFPFNQRVDLVTDNYYEKELKYQEQIDRVGRTSGLNEEVSIERTGSILNVRFPVSYQSVKGEILFYRPSDSSKDFTRIIRTDSLNQQLINVRDLDPGLWKIRVLWDMNNKSYYFEKIVMM